MHRRRAARHLLVTGAAVACVGAVGCLATPAPLGEALIVVRTDASIPRRVNRLRIDVYGVDGTVLDSRELDASSPGDWPISFSVTADRDEERQVFVRLRAYPDGHVMTRAELAAQRASAATELVVHASLEEACAAAPVLTFGQPLTLRRGAMPLTTVLPYVVPGSPATCTQPTAAGSAVARLDVAEQGAYRVEITSASPDGARSEIGGDTTLSLRTDCRFPTTQLACNDDVAAGSRLSGLTKDLPPGTYWVVTGGAEPAPADLTILATRLNAATPAPPPPPPVADPALLEPSPGTTIDRLLRVRLVPGERGTIPITLVGECFGTAADVATAQTCVDKANTLQPVDTIFSRGKLSRIGGRDAPPWQGEETVPCSAQPRPASPLLDDEVCIPGGAFVLGDRLALTDRAFRSQPEHLRVVAPFLLDVHEVTVGRFRDAIRRGLVPLANGVVVNNAPIVGGQTPRVCTWNQDASPTTPAPAIAREAFPLNCVTWEQARAVCTFLGGDLPTEDQWEYAATAAGRPAETQYPWGDDLPDCTRAAVERSDLGDANRCAPAFGPVAVDDGAFAKRDVTPLGVVGMAGNVAEWLATGFYPYSAGPWTQVGLRAPLPAWADDQAPLRSARGGDWAQYALFATASARRAFPVLSQYNNLGFRCARPGR